MEAHGYKSYLSLLRGEQPGSFYFTAKISCKVTTARNPDNLDINEPAIVVILAVMTVLVAESLSQRVTRLHFSTPTTAVFSDRAYIDWLRSYQPAGFTTRIRLGGHFCPLPFTRRHRCLSYLQCRWFRLQLIVSHDTTVQKSWARLCPL